MKKVYQTRVERGNGDCLQATMATLFELELEQVPDFQAYGNNWYHELEAFYKLHGFDMCHINCKDKDYAELVKALRHDKGVNGYFEATVKSKTFANTMHSIVVDSKLNVVHDPNPNGLCLNLLPSSIVSVTVCNAESDWYFNEHDKFVYQK